MLLVKGIKLRPEEDESRLKTLLEKRLRHKIRSYRIYKKSLDARKQPFYVYSILVEIDNERKYLGKDVSLFEEENLEVEYKERNETVIIAGYGPRGIFSAYRLMKAGYKVLVFEKGKRIKEREKDVALFFEKGILNTSSNVQFGEGGAGTFSDAKLTTRIKDGRIHIGDNDLLKVHLLNSAVKMSVERGRGKLVKINPNDHIDGTAALLDAFTVRQKWSNEIGEQLKNERGG